MEGTAAAPGGDLEYEDGRSSAMLLCGTMGGLLGPSAKSDPLPSSCTALGVLRGIDAWSMAFGINDSGDLCSRVLRI